MAVMGHKTHVWIKQEETDEVPDEPVSMVREDEITIEESSFHVKQDPELELHVDGSEHNYVEDTLPNYCSTGPIKECPELNLEADATENIMVTSTRYESDNTRFTEHSGESCGISFEETVHQGVVHNELETGAEELTHFTTFGTHTQGPEEEDNLFGIKLKCLKEKEFHRFSCSYCLQSFPTKYMLIMHVFIHIDGVEPPAYVCKSCGEVFPNIVNLNKHSKVCEGVKDLSPDNNEEFDCSDDRKNIFLERYLEVSLMEQTEKESAFKEDRKISNTSLSDSYNTYTKTHNAEKWDRFNYGTSSTTLNVIHNAIPLNAKGVHKCDVCGRSFNWLGYLKRHAVTHAGTRHKCDVCGKSFFWLSHLKRHALRHTGTRPHKCNVCGRSFTELGHLKSHVLIHAGIRPHKCDVCGMCFTRSSHLKGHSLIHTGRRPHECNVCGTSFSSSSDLKRHALIHIGTREHKCDVCGKSFSRLSNLKDHLLLHTGTKQHKCDFCGKYFSRLSNLKRHSGIHTGKK